MRWKVQGLVLCVCLSAMMTIAQEGVESPVLTVLGDTSYASELGLSVTASACGELDPLIKGIIGPLFADYVKQNNLSATEEDLKEFCRRTLPEGELFSDTWAEWSPHGKRWRARQNAILQLTVWKLQLSLFNQYGGRVMQNRGAQPQAVDAMFAYLAEREEAGDFLIHDDRLKLRFWECMRQPGAPLLSEEEGRALLEAHPADR